MYERWLIVIGVAFILFLWWFEQLRKRTPLALALESISSNDLEELIEKSISHRHLRNKTIRICYQCLEKKGYRYESIAFVVQGFYRSRLSFKEGIVTRIRAPTGRKVKRSQRRYVRKEYAHQILEKVLCALARIDATSSER